MHVESNKKKDRILVFRKDVLFVMEWSAIFRNWHNDDDDDGRWWDLNVLP